MKQKHKFSRLSQHMNLIYCMTANCQKGAIQALSKIKNSNYINTMIDWQIDGFSNWFSDSYQESLSGWANNHLHSPEIQSPLEVQPGQMINAIINDARHSEFISKDSEEQIQAESNSRERENFQLNRFQIDHESTEVNDLKAELREQIQDQADQSRNQSGEEDDGNPVDNQNFPPSKSRPRDENNAHKKYQTRLNKLIPSKIKQSMRATMVLKKLKNEKSQRYGFIIRLIDLMELTSLEYVIGLQNKFNTSINLEFLHHEETQDARYLKSLVNVYQNVYQLFVEDKIQEAVKSLYRSENYKHKEYEKRGLKKVQERLNCYRKN